MLIGSGERRGLTEVPSKTDQLRPRILFVQFAHDLDRVAFGVDGHEHRLGADPSLIQERDSIGHGR